MPTDQEPTTESLPLAYQPASKRHRGWATAGFALSLVPWLIVAGVLVRRTMALWSGTPIGAIDLPAILIPVASVAVVALLVSSIGLIRDRRSALAVAGLTLSAATCVLAIIFAS